MYHIRLVKTHRSRISQDRRVQLVIYFHFCPELPSLLSRMGPVALAKSSSYLNKLMVSGARNEKGEHIPMSVTVGDKVLLPEYGGTKIEIESKEYTIFREADIVAKFSKE